jgi:hypothetical protein
VFNLPERTVYSGDCQRGDGKSHNSMCKSLKKLSIQLQPYHETTKVIEEIRKEFSIKKIEEVRVLGHLISYAEHQFGDRVLGKAYCERGSGEFINNWVVEILILVPIYLCLIDVNRKNESLNMVASDNVTLPN